MLKYIFSLIIFLFQYSNSLSQGFNRTNYYVTYNKALDSIAYLAKHNNPKSFKDAVLLVENTYFNNTLNINLINETFSLLSSFASLWASTNQIADYNASDSS